ncbi:hypothetical protein FPZ24_13910 [Sphingomonas panacisoli]|uniref:Uncharacterized protein n=1 Tax=Sphingomonas panacisoli TaxID=1813879 RepID=A0A5B8LMY2_9SPHN|nr:hypothetical protein [Sphingomonas panacisoli]QDZ08430.1 hypothetical protein FPZ24_13910 [Sphingomonas panacisoli]
MKFSPLLCGAVIAAAIPAAALADDPRDPAMRNAAARARDAAQTRELNRKENDRVVERGVRWWWVRPDGTKVLGNGDYADARRDSERQRADYDRGRARYEQEMADRRACRAGDDDACDREGR